jgi:hypothetical protein
MSQKVANLTTIIERQKVNSSTIRSMGHDERTKTLEVEFYQNNSAKGGAIWRYYSVSPKAFKQLLEAKSIGSHFHQMIKNNPLIIQQKVSDGKTK